MSRVLRVFLVFLLLCSPLLAETLTIEGKRDLSREASQLAEQIWDHVRNQPLAGTNDNAARRELFGLLENLIGLKTAFESGVFQPTQTVQAVAQSHGNFRAQYDALPLDNSQRQQVNRLLAILSVIAPQSSGQYQKPPPQVTTPPVAVTKPQPISGPAPNWCTAIGSGPIQLVAATTNTSLPAGVMALTPAVEVVCKGKALPSELRFQPTKPVTEPQKVALAFLSEGSNRWHFHKAQFDPGRSEVVAQVNHGSVWRVVQLNWGVDSCETAHFKAHFQTNLTNATEVLALLQKMESGRRHLQALGLFCPKAQRDVYIEDRGPAGYDFGAHSLGYSGPYYVLNLPSRLRALNPNVLQAGLVHEVFHDAQITFYQSISTFDARVEAIIGKNMGRSYSYGWLNEMLSTWSELDMIHSTAYPPGGGQIYSHSGGFNQAGLKSKKTANGYGGAVFLDFLTRLYGRELVPNILKVCLRQGPIVSQQQGMLVHNSRRNGLRALQQGILDRSAITGVINSADIAALWKMYVDELLSLNPTHLDPRVDRRKMLNLTASQSLGPNTTQNFQTKVQPLSVGRVGVFKVLPGTGPERDVVFSIKQEVSGSTEVKTIVYAATSYAPQGSKEILSQDAVKATELQGNDGKSTTISFTPDQRSVLVLAVPVGLDGNQPTLVSLQANSADPLGTVTQTQAQQPNYTPTQGQYRPRLRTISPEEGGINHVVTVRGSDFGPSPPNLPRKLSLYSGSAVVFRTIIAGRPAEIEAHIISWSDGTIVVRVPSAGYEPWNPVSVKVYRDRVGSNSLPFKLAK